MDDDGHKTDIPREISEHVSEWKRFGRFLRRSDGRLNQIEIEHPKCYDRVYTIMTEFCDPEHINNSWSFWKKKLLEYPEGDKIIREIEITIPEVINEAPTCHLGICQNNGLLFHHQMSIEKDKPFPISSEKQIAVNIGGGGIELVHYQDYKDFMKTRVDYFNLYEIVSDIKTFDFTTSDQKKCPILNSIRCYLEQSNCNGFAYKGYSLRNHYTLFGEYVVPQEEVNNNILAYFSNDNVLIHFKTCDDIKEISRTLNSFLQDVQLAQAVHECVSNNPIIHIGVVLVDNNILNNNNAFVCYQCVKNCLILPKSKFSTDEGFTDWYNNVIRSGGSFDQMRYSLNSINQALENDVKAELKRNIISQMALKSFDFPSFTPLPDYQMKELEKLVLLTAGQMEILHSSHNHIMIKGSYGSGKSLVLQQRFKQALLESGDSDIFYLVCHDQMSQFAKQMKLMLKQYPEKLILICNGREIETMNISDQLKYIRETWKNRCVHVYIDEFNGQYLDKDEVYKIKEEIKYFKNSHIVIAVQSMEYTFYHKSQPRVPEKDGIDFQFKMLAKEASFCVYQLEYSLRCSLEINSFVNTIIDCLSDMSFNFINRLFNLVTVYDRIIIDRELVFEKVVSYSYDSETYFRYFYNQENCVGHNVSSGKVKIYSPDQGLLESTKCFNMILYHLLTCIQDKVVVSTFDDDIFEEVQNLLKKAKFNWTTDIEEFMTMNSSFQVLLTDYASIRGFEFSNVIFLLGPDYNFLKFRLVECFTRATTSLSLVFKFSVHELLDLLNSCKTSNFVEYKVLYFDHAEDTYYFQSSDESEREMLVQNVSAECTFTNQIRNRSRYPWSIIMEKKRIIHQTNNIKATVEIIFKQDNVKLFEDLFHLHSIDTLVWELMQGNLFTMRQINLLHLTAECNASNLCTLICNQYKQLVNSYINCEYTPLHVAAENNSNLVAAVLIKHGAQVNIRYSSLDETPLHIAAKYNSDKVASILLDHGADVNCEDYIGNTPLHDALRFSSYKTSKLLLDRGTDVNIQNKESQTPLGIALRMKDSILVSLLRQHQTK